MKSQSTKSYIGDNSQRSGGLNEDYENNEDISSSSKNKNTKYSSNTKLSEKKRERPKESTEISEKAYKEKKFLYACPFLIDDRCSLYKYRGIICRSHGAAFFSKDNKLMVPACVEEGLNYSNVYDFYTQTISTEKYKDLGISQEPLAHNIGLHYLTNNEMTEAINLDFGELKPMCEWFIHQIK